MERRPYPSARKDDCFDPGAGPAQVAKRCPDSRLIDQPNDMDLSKADPSLTASSWMSMSGLLGGLEEIMSSSS